MSVKRKSTVYRKTKKEKEIKKNNINYRVVTLESSNSEISNDIKIIKTKTCERLGIYYQTSKMRSLYEMCGTSIFFDDTYNLFTNNLTLFILSVINPEGKTSPVLFFSTINETFESLCAFFDEFQKYNNIAITTTITSDKDLTERKGLKNYFFNAKFRLCFFYVGRTLSTKKNILKILYVNSAEEYDDIRNSLEFGEERYFIKNLERIRDEFVPFFAPHGTLRNEKTNNRSESFNAKLKRKFKTKSEEIPFFLALDEWIVEDKLNQDREILNNI